MASWIDQMRKGIQKKVGRVWTLTKEWYLWKDGEGWTGSSLRISHRDGSVFTEGLFNSALSRLHCKVSDDKLNSEWWCRKEFHMSSVTCVTEWNE